MKEQEKPKRKRGTDYRKFYTCPNKGILDSVCGRPEGYITKDGMWAAVPIMGSKKLQIINNGNFVHVARNYDSAKAYILREKKKSK
tara:strand:+ start:690 stop:947 length:258 start_codon:yes stop_codon:yes gene_type:complete